MEKILHEKWSLKAEKTKTRMWKSELTFCVFIILSFETSDFFFNNIWPHSFFGVFWTCIWNSFKKDLLVICENNLEGKKTVTCRRIENGLINKSIVVISSWIDLANLLCNVLNINPFNFSKTFCAPRWLWLL